jgi:hypothetical protein
VLRPNIKKPATKFVHVLIVVSIVIFVGVLTRSLAIAEAAKTGRSPSLPLNGMATQAETKRILWVLENRTEGQLLQEKAKDKLSTLRPEQIRLLDSLAVRIMESNSTIASDIVFLLIAALLISS